MDFIGAYKLEYLSFLLEGLLVTLEVAILTVILSLLFGCIIGFARFTKYPVISHLATLYIECMRNVPPLLIIFFTFFALPDIGMNFDKKTAAIVALTAYGTALMAEIVRAGFQSIEKGQLEAARSQGFTYMQTMRYIFFPQAMKRMIPAFVGQVITLVKNSSLAVVISLEELTKAGQIIYLNNVQYVIPILLLIAFIYFVINFSLSLLSRFLEKKLEYTNINEKKWAPNKFLKILSITK